MKLSDSTSLFHFKHKVDSIQFEKDILQTNSNSHITNTYEHKIIKFLNYWFEFNIKNKHIHDSQKGMVKESTKSVVDYALYQIFGERYYTNLLSFLTTRLRRFRHILYEEEEKTFEAAFSDYIKDNQVVMQKAIDNSENQSILIRFKQMFEYYKKIHTLEDKQLMTIFNEEINDISSIYLGYNFFTDKILPFIESNIFYGTPIYKCIREKVLIIVYELISRFFERLHISPYDNKVPLSQYIKDFYKIQKAIVSNDILYIFLKDSRNVLVYDFTNKIPTDTDNPLYEHNLQKYDVIDSIHRMYIIQFSQSVDSIVYDDNTLILSLQDGTLLVNGKNTNKRLSESDTSEFIKFITFNVSDIKKEITSLKIRNTHIYIHSKDTLYIYGLLDDTNCVPKNECVEISERVHKKDIKGFDDFIISKDESTIKFLTKEMVGKQFLNEHSILDIKSKHELQLTHFNQITNTEEIYHYNLLNMNPLFSVSHIFILEGGAFIIEVLYKKPDNDVEYNYFIIGSDKENTFRLGFNESNFDESNPSITHLHDISSKIQLNKDNSLNKKIYIKKIESFSDKTLILTSAGLIFGAGKNGGYFIEKSDDTLQTFTQLITNEFREPLDDFCLTRTNGKNLVFGYNETTGYGFGPYRFFGMKHGGDFIFNETEINEKLADDSINTYTDPDKMAYFCTPNCMYYLNPIYDLISYFYLVEPKVSNDSIDHVKNSLKYLEDMSVMSSEDVYEHLIGNLNIINDESCRTNNGFNQNLYYFSNLQNYAMHDAMMYMYAVNKEDYGSLASFINLMGLMGENYSAMKTKYVKLGNMDIGEFKAYIADLNYEMRFEKEQRYEKTRKNKHRAI